MAIGENDCNYRDGSSFSIADTFISLTDDITFHRDGIDMNAQKVIDDFITENKMSNKSLYQKWKDGEITRTEYRDYCAKINGFKNRREQDETRRRTKGIKPQYSEMHRKFVNGEITRTEYDNWVAQKKGFKDSSEYTKNRHHITNRHRPMQENKNCSAYLGVFIAERILSKVWEKVKRMPLNNIGYDYLCTKNYKIDVKSSSFQRGKRRITDNWSFKINGNKIADYFLLIGFDNRKNLNPLKIWLIKGTEIIRDKELNKFHNFIITNTPKGLSQFSRFEQNDKLEKTIDCCDSLKEAS